MKPTIIEIGIDIDTLKDHILSYIFRRLDKLKEEKIVSSYRHTRSKHGFHIHIRLWKAITFERSIELRLFLGDDPLRMVKDIVKVWAGASEFDLLFTKKWRGWKK